VEQLIFIEPSAAIVTKNPGGALAECPSAPVLIRAIPLFPHDGHWIDTRDLAVIMLAKARQADKRG
jgi:hypothetical protein